MQKKSVDYVSRQLPLQGLDLDSAYHSQESTQSEQLGQTPISYQKQGKLNQTIGLAGEDLVRYILHRWRYEIFEPVNPSSRCDFVINHNNKWTTIQVKATELERVTLHRERKKAQSHGRREVFQYTEEDFNFLFIAKFPKIYVIPFEMIKGRGSIPVKDYEDFSYDLNDPETYNNPPNL